MKPTTSKYGRGLFPSYFKFIGLAIIALSFAGALLAKPYITVDQKPLAKTITINVIIIGLFFIAWTRNKVEDEMSVHLRFQAMALAFLFGIMFCLFHPVVSSFLNDTDLDISGQQLVMTMLLFFIFTYTIKRRSNK